MKRKITQTGFKSRKRAAPFRQLFVPRPIRKVGIKPELKRMNIDLQSNSQSTTPIKYSLAYIQEGTESYNRVGRQVRIKRIDLSLLFQPCGAGTWTPIAQEAVNIFRITVHKPYSSPVMDATAGETYLMGGSIICAPFDWDKTKVLWDKNFTVSWGPPATNDPAETTFNVPRYKFIKKSFLFKGAGLRVNYTGAQASQATRNVPVLQVISDSSVASHPTWTGNYSVSFYDV